MDNDIRNLHEIFCQEEQVLRNISPRTVQWWYHTFDFFARHGQVTRLDQVTSECLRGFFLWGRSTRKWTPDTHLNYYKGIRAFLKWCVQRRFLDENPLDGIPQPRLGKKLPKRISESDLRLVLDTALGMRYTYRFERFRNHAYLSMLACTGLRLQESLSLRVGDVDLDQNLVSVHSGKGNKDRIVPMCRALKMSLLPYMKERKRLHRQCPVFFSSIRGDQPFTASGVKFLVQRLRKATGVNFSPHKLRHTFATLMIENNCDLFALSKMLGHSDIKTTTIYLSASVEHLRSQIQKHPLDELNAAPGIGSPSNRGLNRRETIPVRSRSYDLPLRSARTSE